MASPTQIGSAVALLTVVLLGPRVGSSGIVYGAVGSLAAGMLYKSMRARQQQDSLPSSQAAEGNQQTPLTSFEDRSNLTASSTLAGAAGAATSAASTSANITSSTTKKKGEKKSKGKSDEDFEDWDVDEADARKNASNSMGRKPAEAKSAKKSTLAAPKAQPPKPQAQTQPQAAAATVSTESASEAEAAAKKKKKAKKKSVASTGAPAEVEAVAEVPVEQAPAPTSPEDDEGWQPVISKKKRKAVATQVTATNQLEEEVSASEARNGNGTESPAEESVIAELPAEPTSVVEPVQPPQLQKPVPDAAAGESKKKKKNKKSAGASNEVESATIEAVTNVEAKAQEDNPDEWTVVGRRKGRS